MCIFTKKASFNLSSKKMLTVIVFTICLLISLSAYAEVPVIKNMGFQYIAANNVLRTWYDLSYSGVGSVNISLEASEDGGKNFNIIPTQVSGDFGLVFPGTGKKANWNIGSECPWLDPQTVIMRIVASDADHTIRYITVGGTMMVLVPGGSNDMGSIDTPPDGMPIFGDELPEHTVTIDSFYMDVSEVTNAKYAEFMSATGYPAPIYWADPRFNAPEQPVVGLKWEDAIAFCNWMGKRLPTEAEWERACRGGHDGRDFPWGNVLDYNYGNFASVKDADIWYDTAPVCSFKPNDYGLFDMIGNVYEWCSDYYEYGYYANSPVNNPMGPATGTTRVLRGGSCYDGFFPSYLRCATRYSYFGATMNGLIGLRCAMSIPQ
jgi:iron(II)-dependent oxidoreductase